MMTANDSVDSKSNLTAINIDKRLQEVLAEPKVAITSTLLLLLMALIFLGNLMVIRTVYMTPKLHCPAFYFVVSLAVADFMVGFLVPVSVVYNVTSEMTGRWMAGEIACDIWTFANIWFVCASLLNLCVVSWDRYIAVTSPLTYKLTMHGKKVKVFIVIVWTLSLVAAICYTVAFKLSTRRRLCITNGLSIDQTIPSFLIIYVIPTLFLLFVNGRVLQIARKHRRHIQIQEITVSNLSVSQPHDANRNHRLSAIVNELKTFKTFVIVIGTFVLCWSPYFLLSLLSHFLDLPPRLPHVTVILFYVKSALNPLIYGTHNRELRAAAADSFKRRRRRIESNSSELETNDLPTEFPESDVKNPNNLRENDSTRANELRQDDIGIPNMVREMDVTMLNGLKNAESRAKSPLKIEDILAKPS